MAARSAAEIPGDQAAAVYAQQLVERWVGGIARVTNAYVVASALPERNPKPQAAATVAAASPRTYNRIFDGNIAKVIIVSPPVKLSQMPSPNGTVIFCAEVCAEISLGQY